MSDKPMDTPFSEMSDEEIAGMTSQELMDRAIATNDLGVDGFLDTVVTAALVETMHAVSAVQRTTLAADRDDPSFALMVEVLAQELHAHLSSVFDALIETGRRIGHKEGLEDGNARS